MKNTPLNGMRKISDKALNPINTAGRKKGRYEINENIKEWRKKLEEVVKKTLDNNTNLYFNVEVENQQDPRWHFKYRFP
eukprot:8137104-Ditylum_brightwellii.AAC.1